MKIDYNTNKVINNKVNRQFYLLTTIGLLLLWTLTKVPFSKLIYKHEIDSNSTPSEVLNVSLPKIEESSPQALPIYSSTKNNANKNIPKRDNLSRLKNHINVLKINVKEKSNLYKIFKNEKLNTSFLRQIINTAPQNISNHINKLASGQYIEITYNGRKEVKQVLIYLADDSILKIKQQENGLLGYQVSNIPITTKIEFIQNSIEGSLANTVKSLGLPPKIIQQISNIFKSKINFSKDINPGASFKILLEKNYYKDKLKSTGNIIAIEILNKGKKYYAVRFKNNAGKVHYYTPSGQNLEASFIKYPVKYTRISSRFSLNRKHPILGKVRPHKGVDFAAPIGTPVRATSDGRIKFIGHKGGYGKVIIVKHGSKYTTLYAHLNNFSPRIRLNSRVNQGQIIGYVGKTGLAAGPHLHYEFRINGVHKDPLKVSFPVSNIMETQDKNSFIRHLDNITALMRKYNESLS